MFCLCSDKSISIHAPREGGDASFSRFSQYRLHISIHAPREGGDETITLHYPQHFLFQSTPPARGATYMPDHY